MEEITLYLLVSRVMLLRINHHMSRRIDIESVNRYGDEITKRLRRQNIKYISKYTESDWAFFKKYYGYHFEFCGNKIILKPEIRKSEIHADASICTNQILNVMLDENVIRRSGILK
ncbi:MAG: hypothetical protein IJ809_06105 [Clostridia bacterium]|nr:hypothetical protein [Clostridia bacterium]